jgi:hypothetical protein
VAIGLSGVEIGMGLKAFASPARARLAAFDFHFVLSRDGHDAAAGDSPDAVTS